MFDKLVKRYVAEEWITNRWVEEAETQVRRRQCRPGMEKRVIDARSREEDSGCVQVVACGRPATGSLVTQHHCPQAVALGYSFNSLGIAPSLYQRHRLSCPTEFLSTSTSTRSFPELSVMSLLSY